MNRYRNPALKLLRDQQIRFAPKDVRLKQVDRAELLLAELDPRRTYGYPELCEKITSYRSEMNPDLVITGEEAVHDLRCFVEDLSESIATPVESVGEDVWTVADVSKRYNVSEKTVNRWPTKVWSAGGSRWATKSAWGSCVRPWNGSCARIRRRWSAAARSASCPMMNGN